MSDEDHGALAAGGEERHHHAHVMRRISLILFVAVVVLSIDYRTVGEAITMRATLSTALQKRAERVPGFTEFLEGVRGATKNGDTIALIAGAPDPRTYGYARIRAAYVLAGRTVVPMMSDEGTFQAAAVRDAQYLALFRTEYRGRGVVVWKGRDGMLVKQR